VTQSGDTTSLLSAYRGLIRVRAGHPALAGGSLIPIDAADRHVVAFLRSSGDTHALVVANLGREAAVAPALTLGKGPLCGEPIATALLGPGNVASPAVSPTGGFERYVPIVELAAREVIVLELVTP
jgi:glycosidase